MTRVSNKYIPFKTIKRLVSFGFQMTDKLVYSCSQSASLLFFLHLHPHSLVSIILAFEIQGIPEAYLPNLHISDSRYQFQGNYVYPLPLYDYAPL